MVRVNLTAGISGYVADNIRQMTSGEKEYDEPVKLSAQIYVYTAGGLVLS